MESRGPPTCGDSRPGFFHNLKIIPGLLPSQRAHVVLAHSSMAPLWTELASTVQTTSRLLPRSLSEVQTQWVNPSDLLSVLLILGGDVVQTAIAQLSGGHFPITPVAFSFGWVAFSLNAVLTSMDDGRLMPRPEKPSIVINVSNGISRPNQSWVLSRVLRDWKDDERYRSDYSLCVSILRTDRRKQSGRPEWDLLMYFGVITIVTQFGIALVPGVKYGAWEILIITGWGTILALLGSSLPEWRVEKWSGGRRLIKPKTICLTPGNGSNRVIIITSREGDLDLEALASARFESDRYTKAATVILAICWILLLLTVAGIKENSWFLLLVGTLGMMQNIAAAGLHRHSSALGIHLEPDRGEKNDKEPYIYPKDKLIKVKDENGNDTEIKVKEGTMDILMRLENRFPPAGSSLLDEFFRKGLRDKEKRWWNEKAAEYQQNKEKAKHEAEEKTRKAEQEKPTAVTGARRISMPRRASTTTTFENKDQNKDQISIVR